MLVGVEDGRRCGGERSVCGVWLECGVFVGGELSFFWMEGLFGISSGICTVCTCLSNVFADKSRYECRTGKTITSGGYRGALLALCPFSFRIQPRRLKNPPNPNPALFLSNR